MRIGELADITGVDVETIRYYEKAGLLAPPARESNGYRTYGKSHLEDCGDVNVLIDSQLNRVRARLKSMRALEKQLTALRKQCTEPHGTSECGILHDLVAAAHGEACACHVGH